MKVPDYDTCRRLLDDFAVPEHIVEHSCQVARISVCLGRGLQRRGEAFDLELLAAAGLLHDIAKMASLENGQDHAELGASWLERRGYVEIAEIVRNHVRLETDLGGPLAAKEIVFYADKRVRHIEIVSVGERMRDLKVRYGFAGCSLEWLMNLENFTLEVENKIFSRLDFSPDRVAGRAAARKIC